MDKDCHCASVAYIADLDSSQSSYSKVLSCHCIKLNLEHVKACAVPRQNCHAVHS